MAASGGSKHGGQHVDMVDFDDLLLVVVQLNLEAAEVSAAEVTASSLPIEHQQHSVMPEQARRPDAHELAVVLLLHPSLLRVVHEPAAGPEPAGSGDQRVREDQVREGGGGGGGEEGLRVEETSLILHGQAPPQQQAIQGFTAGVPLNHRHLSVPEEVGADGSVWPVGGVDNCAVEDALVVGAEVGAEVEVLVEDRRSRDVALQGPFLVYELLQHGIHRSERTVAVSQHLVCSRPAVQDGSGAEGLVCPCDAAQVAVQQVPAVLEASFQVEKVGRGREVSDRVLD
mmetsp:Transcript_46129/g.144698  ORF Transcript_46129/g.144698 Transcript_46129/m.144698 type:complete len:285 (+) Transcript_46129:748-1602(+)